MVDPKLRPWSTGCTGLETEWDTKLRGEGCGRVSVFYKPPQLLTRKRPVAVKRMCCWGSAENNHWHSPSLTEPEWCLFGEQRKVVIILFLLVFAFLKSYVIVVTRGGLLFIYQRIFSLCLLPTTPPWVRAQGPVLKGKLSPLTKGHSGSFNQGGWKFNDNMKHFIIIINTRFDTKT